MKKKGDDDWVSGHLESGMIGFWVIGFEDMTLGLYLIPQNVQ